MNTSLKLSAVRILVLENHLSGFGYRAIGFSNAREGDFCGWIDVCIAELVHRKSRQYFLAGQDDELTGEMIIVEVKSQKRKKRREAELRNASDGDVEQSKSLSECQLVSILSSTLKFNINVTHFIFCGSYGWLQPLEMWCWNLILTTKYWIWPERMVIHIILLWFGGGGACLVSPACSWSILKRAWAW